MLKTKILACPVVRVTAEDLNFNLPSNTLETKNGKEKGKKKKKRKKESRSHPSWPSSNFDIKASNLAEKFSFQNNNSDSKPSSSNPKEYLKPSIGTHFLSGAFKLLDPRRSNIWVLKSEELIKIHADPE